MSAFSSEFSSCGCVCWVGCAGVVPLVRVSVFGFCGFCPLLVAAVWLSRIFRPGVVPGVVVCRLVSLRVGFV